ncbi:unnamed protein product [Clavelina lepadiformis]|uniref:Uncharacterized protein n=1 Tax=Clavelina lepadiformis TaxID=159417 RepID=A0ABP0GXW7_CLALP
MCFTQGRAALLVAYLLALFSDGYCIADCPDKDYYIGKRILLVMFSAIDKTGTFQDNLLERGVAEPKQPSYTSKAAKNKEEMANNVKSAFQSSDGWCSTELCPGYVPDSSLAFPSVKAGTL